MDKRNPKKLKEREKSAKKNRKKSNNQQIVLQKDIIYCKNTIQNTNPNINISINIKNSKNKSSNRIKSAHYTIHSKQINPGNKSVDKKRPYELKKIYLNTNANHTLSTNTKLKNSSLKAYFMNTNNNYFSNPKASKSNNMKRNNKSNKISFNLYCTNKSDQKNKNKKYGTAHKTNNELIEKIMENKYEPKATLFSDDMEIMSEYENLKSLWNELGITNNFIQNFEYMNNNKNNNRDEILQIIKTEKKQMLQFKNELLRVLKEIEKREEEIKNIQLLNQQYSNLRIFYNFENESDVKNNIENKNIISRKELETQIKKCLSSLRLRGINTVSQLKKFKMKYSYLVNIGKIDINYLYEVYGYNKNYLIKLINDLNFLKDTNLKDMYFFSEKGEDPFLLSITGKKDIISSYRNKESDEEKEYDNEFDFSEEGNKRYKSYGSQDQNDNNYSESENEKIIDGKKYKIIPISKELLGVVKKLLYYLNQEKLFLMVKFGEEAVNSLNTENNDNYLYDNSINNRNNTDNNLTIENEIKDRNFINRSRAIATLKNTNTNQYNKLFFNKTLSLSRPSNTDKGMMIRDKINLLSDKNPVKLQKDLILDKDKANNLKDNDEMNI